MVIGQPRIVVGTPGRITDLWESKRMVLSQVKFLILDEARSATTRATPVVFWQM